MDTLTAPHPMAAFYYHTPINPPGPYLSTCTSSSHSITIYSQSYKIPALSGTRLGS